MNRYTAQHYLYPRFFFVEFEKKLSRKNISIISLPSYNKNYINK